VLPPQPNAIDFPMVGSPYETPAPRSTRESRTTPSTPSDSASNVHNYLYGNGTVPGTVTGSPRPDSTVSKKGKKGKERSTLSTIPSASNFIFKPSAEQPQPPEPAPTDPHISIPPSPSVSSSIGGSRLTTNHNTPLTTRLFQPSIALSLSYATNHPKQPPALQPPAVSRQNSDSAAPGGPSSAPGGVFTGVWGS
jgi:hypothetical protein